MFRAVRTTSKLRVTDWIPKMFFFWDRKPASVGAALASPRAGPWFAWFATAVLLWQFRRRIARVVCGANSPLRLLRRKRPGAAASLVVSKAHKHHHHHHQQQQRHHLKKQLQAPASAPASSGDHRRVCHQNLKYQQHSNNPNQQQQQYKPQALRRDVNNASVKPRLRQLHAGDGPHVTSAARKLAVSSSCVQISQQLYCRMTRSGRVYGRYPNKQVDIK